MYHFFRGALGVCTVPLGLAVVLPVPLGSASGSVWREALLNDAMLGRHGLVRL